MNRRILAALAALALAPAALAQQPEEAPAPAAPPAAATQPAPAAPPADAAEVATVAGKVEVLGEQVAEVKTAVDALRKLRLSGYIQARYANLEQNGEGANNAIYNEGPGVGPNRDNFYIRRGRLKAVYDADWAQYVLQLDVVPAGVSIKEGYAAIKLPKGWAIDVGLQLFPFGYEVFSRSSSDLDTLERARVTRAFLNGEYDLGAALRGKLGPVSLKVGVFNGNGIDGPGDPNKGRDNDQLKDVIGRATVDFGWITAGASGWYGKSIDYSRADDRKFDRVRAAADVQLFLDLLPIGGTAIKGEYIWGRNTIGGGNANAGAGGNLPGATSDAPLPTGSGWYAILTQNLLDHHQLAARYEEFTPNHTADAATVKTQQEIQLALHTFVGESAKVTLAWWHPLKGRKGDDATTSPTDPKADAYVVQVQAKF